MLSTVQANSLLLLLLCAFVSAELDEPKAEPLQSSVRLPTGQSVSYTPNLPIGELPIFPERPDAVYFVVAVSGGAKSWGRALARTLLDMGAPFSNPQGPPLRPIYVDLPTSGRWVSFLCFYDFRRSCLLDALDLSQQLSEYAGNKFYGSFSAQE